MENNTDDKSFITIRLNFLTILGIAFIVLKLCGTIDWSWWLVLLPIIIEILL